MKKSTKPTTMIYWTVLQHESWKLYLAATSKGLCYVGTAPFTELEDWVRKHIPDSVTEYDDAKLHPYVVQYVEYFQGMREEFTFSIDLYGTSFQVAVWHALRHIPHGQLCSYSDVANQIQRPTAVRAVGAAIGANPILISVPCHRVIGKNGSLTGFREGLEMKRQLLQLERVFPLD